MIKAVKKIWKILPYPITHLYQCLNTAHEWHIFIQGFCFPACKVWRIKIFPSDIGNSNTGGELHYFMVGVLLSTIVIAVLAVLALKLFI